MIQLLINLSGRERLMLASFLVVMILLWGSSLLARWERASVTLGEARSEIRQQNVWIENAGLFEEKLQEVLAQVDPAKMMDGAALSAFVDSFARTNDLRYEITAPSSEQNSIFTESSLRATFRNVSLEKLVELQLLLRAERPYVAAESIALVANRADPRLLNARLSLNAILVDADRASSPESNP